MFVVTEEWLRQNATANVGWTRRQLAVLGVPWPPAQWLKPTIGKTISLDAKAEFEKLGEQRRTKIYQKGKLNDQIHALVSVARKRHPYLEALKQGKIIKRVAVLLNRKRPDLLVEKIEMMKEFLGMASDAATDIPILTGTYVREPKIKKPRQKRKRSGFWNDSFFDSREWKELRYKAIKLHGRKCMACGQTDGIFHVDHIKPRSKFPELALVLSNLQVLCADCNLGKGAWDQTDWRPPENFVELVDADREGKKLN
jgi:hypothetical protein